MDYHDYVMSWLLYFSFGMFTLLAASHDRYQIPDPWPYQEARHLFKEPKVTPVEEIPDFKWAAPDAEVVFLWFMACYSLSIIQHCLYALAAVI